MNSPLQISEVISYDDSKFVDATFDYSTKSSLETIINAKYKTFHANSWTTLEDEDISEDKLKEDETNEVELNEFQLVVSKSQKKKFRKRSRSLKGYATRIKVSSHNTGS